MLQLEFEPEGLTEKVGDKLGFVKRRAKGDLERFKNYIEAHGRETGAWRGEVPVGGDRAKARPEPAKARGKGGDADGGDSFGVV
jgi:hypothetical protein